MQVVVVGGGSVGLLMAARLQAGGAHVHLLTRSEEQAMELHDSRLLLTQEDGTTIRIPITATSVKVDWPKADVYLLAVKQTQLKDVLPQLQQIPSHARVIALQNGMGHKELLESVLSTERLYFGVNTEGARRVTPSQVIHTGKGTIQIGPWDDQGDENAVIQKFVSLAKECKIPTEYVSKTSPLLWRKLMANAVINPLTTIFEISNGELLGLPSTLEMMRAIFDEACEVANVSGHKITESYWQDILAICRNTSQNYSSMLQDFLNQQPTEIDSINGYLVEKAREHKLNTPVNETLYRTILMKSNLQRSKGETFDANTD